MKKINSVSAMFFAVALGAHSASETMNQTPNHLDENTEPKLFTIDLKYLKSNSPHNFPKHLQQIDKNPLKEIDKSSKYNRMYSIEEKALLLTLADKTNRDWKQIFEYFSKNRTIDSLKKQYRNCLKSSSSDYLRHQLIYDKLITAHNTYGHDWEKIRHCFDIKFDLVALWQYWWLCCAETSSATCEICAKGMSKQRRKLPVNKCIKNQKETASQKQLTCFYKLFQEISHR